MEPVLSMARSAFTHKPAEQLDQCDFCNQCGYLPNKVAGGLSKVKAQLLAISTIAKTNDAKLYLLIYPWPAQLACESTVVDWEKHINDVCLEIGCDGVIDVFPQFKAFKVANPDWYPQLFVKGDTHYNPKGNQLVADEILAFLAKHP